MVRVTALYPRAAGAHFDHDYYRDVHLPLAARLLQPFGLLWIEGDRTVPVSGPSGGFVAQTHSYFETLEQARAAAAATLADLVADVPNYTNITPVLEFREVWRLRITGPMR